MRSHAKALASAGLAVLLLGAAGCGPLGTRYGDGTGAADSTATSDAGQPEELTIAIAGMVTPEEGLEYYQDLSRYIGRKVGMPVRLFHKAEYSEVNRMIEERKIDLAFVCAGPYVTGHDAFGMELLAAPVVNGAPVYYSYIIVPADSPVTDLEGLRGKTFAFADPQSNTGKLVPTYLLAKMGEAPDSFFGRTFYTYSHDVSIKAVAEKEADGAAVDSLIWDYANGKDPTYTSRTRIVLKSDPYGIPPVVVHPDMDPALKKQLRDAFVDASKDPEAQPILGHMGIERFTVVTDSAYDSIRAMNEWIAKNK